MTLCLILWFLEVQIAKSVDVPVIMEVGSVGGAGNAEGHIPEELLKSDCIEVE